MALIVMSLVAVARVTNREELCVTSECNMLRQNREKHQLEEQT
jgi:hypothetical protein